MTTRLTDLTVKEVAFCRRGMNPKAKIALFKMADLGKAQTKTEGGKAFPASDFAYVPDAEKPTTWKLRLTSTPGGDPDPAIVGAAAAALSPAGFRGNTVDIPAADKAGVVARVRRAWRKANPDKKPEDMPEAIKSADGCPVCSSELAKAAYAVAETMQPVEERTGAKDFATLFAQDEAERRECDASQEMWPLFNALRESLTSIVADSALDETAKLEMIRRSVEDFMNEVADKVPEVEAELTKIFTALKTKGTHAGDLAGDPASKKEHTMSGDTPTVADLQKSVADMTAELKTAKAMAELSDAAKDYLKSLTKEDATAFLAMTPEQRTQKMALAKANDETITVDGRVIRKSVVGEDAFAVMKAQQTSIEANATALKAATEKADMAEFTKRADGEFAHVAGTTDEKAKMLKAIAGITDEAVRKSFDTVLKAAEAMAKAGFDRIGHGNGQVVEGSAEDQLVKKANEYAKANKVSYEVAYDKVCQAEPALYDKALAEKPSVPAAN
jgi:hypothetical protein